jgi:hypothetical protein
MGKNYRPVTVGSRGGSLGETEPQNENDRIKMDEPLETIEDEENKELVN